MLGKTHKISPLCVDNLSTILRLFLGVFSSVFQNFDKNKSLTFCYVSDSL